MTLRCWVQFLSEFHYLRIQYTDQFFYYDCLDLYGVLSKMEQLLELFQNGGFKMMDGSGSLFNNTWRHYDITAIFKDYLCVS